MSARSKIVRDFSGQEVAIPYDPCDDAQHTPGPWTLGPVEPAEISKGHWITHGSYKGVIGILGGSPSEANAALIAAAPETAAERDRLRESNGAMLEALKAGVLAVANNPIGGPWEQVAAAIAAAEGK